MSAFELIGSRLPGRILLIEREQDARPGYINYLPWEREYICSKDEATAQFIHKVKAAFGGFYRKGYIPDDKIFGGSIPALIAENRNLSRAVGPGSPGLLEAARTSGNLDLMRAYLESPEEPEP